MLAISTEARVGGEWNGLRESVEQGERVSWDSACEPLTRQRNRQRGQKKKEKKQHWCFWVQGSNSFQGEAAVNHAEWCGKSSKKEPFDLGMQTCTALLLGLAILTKNES